MSAFALLIPPANLPVYLQQLTERSSTMRASLNLLFRYTADSTFGTALFASLAEPLTRLSKLK